jgi:hypothetical protein
VVSLSVRNIDERSRQLIPVGARITLLAGSASEPIIHLSFVANAGGPIVRLELVDLDERVANVRELEAKASKSKRVEFDEQLVRSWVFHDLQVEGVALYEDDIDRAFEGEEGNDYCDGVLLDQIRNFRSALKEMRKAAREGTPVSLDLMFSYQHLIEPTATEDPVRNEDGATENYKHDVAEPEDAMDEAKVGLEMLQKDSKGFHPVETAIEAQYKLLMAWPLARWNAAVTRLLTNQYLTARGYPPLIVPAHSRQQYYHALNYDIRRLRSLLMECMEQQISLRERFFGS